MLKSDKSSIGSGSVSDGVVYPAAMASWGEIEAAFPEFARMVRSLFDAGRHKTLATIRKDGSPRISGIECEFENGQLRFGSMPGAVKSADLRRDPRLALHGPTLPPVVGEEKDWPGEAKIGGVALKSDQPKGEGPEADYWIVDLREVVFTHLNDDATRLVVESWHPDRGLSRIERD